MGVFSFNKMCLEANIQTHLNRFHGVNCFIAGVITALISCINCGAIDIEPNSCCKNVHSSTKACVVNTDGYVMPIRPGRDSLEAWHCIINR